MNIEIKTDNKDLLAHLEELKAKITPAAQVAVLNRTASKVSREAIKIASKSTGVPTKTLRKRINIPRQWKARKGKLNVTIFGGTWPVKVSKLKPAPRQLKSGRVKYKTAPGTAVDPQAFIATNTNGGTSVWKRKGKNRLPVKNITIDIAPGVKAALIAYGNGAEAKNFYEQALFKEMDRKIRGALVRRGVKVS